MIFFQIHSQIVIKIQQQPPKGHLFNQSIMNFQDLIITVVVIAIVINIIAIAIAIVLHHIQIMVMQPNVLRMPNQYQVHNILVIVTCQR